MHIDVSAGINKKQRQNQKDENKVDHSVIELLPRVCLLKIQYFIEDDHNRTFRVKHLQSISVYVIYYIGVN